MADPPLRKISERLGIELADFEIRSRGLRAGHGPPIASRGRIRRPPGKDVAIIMKTGWSQEEMADEIIAMLADGSSLNLGIGMPTLIAERMPAAKGIFIHSENGVLGIKGRPTPATLSPTLINAGKESISVRPGVSYFRQRHEFRHHSRRPH